MTMLREEHFACLLIAIDGERETDAASRPAAAASLSAFLGALQTSGFEEPIVLLTAPDADDVLLSEGAVDCEVLISAAGWQSPALPLWIYRAIHRRHDSRESRLLSTADRRRMNRERDETDQLLQQQRQMVLRAKENPRGLRRRSADATYADSPAPPLPHQVQTYYQELLRTYVIMGSGNLQDEICRLAEVLAAADVGPRAAMCIHLDQLDQLAHGLGSRSSRHVMARADILAIELLMQLGEFYRRKSQARGIADFGIDLMHAHSLRQKKDAA